MAKTGAIRWASILGRVIAYYVGGSFLFEFWSLSYASGSVSEFNVVRFDPYLVAVSVFVVILGQGLLALRRYPATREHLLSGAFKQNEVILIESLTVFGVTALYAFIEYGNTLDIAGEELFSTLLGGTLSAMFEVTVAFYILRWLYVISKSSQETAEQPTEI